VKVINVSEGAALEAANLSAIRWMKASTAADDVERLVRRETGEE
jgi:hypothetical protein